MLSEQQIIIEVIALQKYGKNLQETARSSEKGTRCDEITE